jgi:hypothetical protein
LRPGNGRGILHPRHRLQRHGDIPSQGRDLLVNRWQAGGSGRLVSSGYAARRRGTGDRRLPAGWRGDRLKFNRIQLGSEPGNDGSPTVTVPKTGPGSVLQNDVCPALEGRFGNVKSPANRFKEHQFILIDLQRVKTRDLAPSTGRIVAILQVFGSENQSRKEHATTALHGPADRLVARLLCLAGHMRLDLDQIIKSHLQRAVASPRPTQSLLDEGAKRQHALATSRRVTTKRYCGQGPDNLNNLRCGAWWQDLVD